MQFTENKKALNKLEEQVERMRAVNARKSDLYTEILASKSLDCKLKGLNNEQSTSNDDTSANDDTSTNDDTSNDDTSNDDHNGLKKALEKIKRSGEELQHQQCQHGSSLSRIEKNTMCLGLSSILDFVDEDPEGQRSLFDYTDWCKLRNYCKTRFESEPFELPSSLDEVWKQVVKFCQQGGNKSARRYVSQKLLEGSVDDVTFVKGLEIVEQVLIMLDRHSVMLDPMNLSSCAEYDIAFKIWLPLIDCLFGGTSRIFSKIAETTNSYSSEMKRQQYANATHIISFKIDFRLLLHHHTEDIDLLAGEAAKNNNEDKIKMDHAKLTGEAKDILDRLLMINVDGNHTYSWKGASIQLAGLQGQISTIHLDDSGVYVMIPGSRLTFPQSLASLPRFLPTLKALLQLRLELETLGMEVFEQLDLANEKRESLGTTFFRPSSPLPESSMKRLKKSTYYPPPPKK
ncbi:unnamed protein product [Absidia cylindrospora]